MDGDFSRVRPRGFSRVALTDAKERVRAILADKSTLLRVRLLPRERMAKKDERANCVFCDRRFRTFSRKVHCRSCGEVVCSSCYRKKDVQVGPTSSDTMLVRLCFDCIDRALTAPSLKNQDESDDVVEGSFTNSGRVTLSVCSAHMTFVDGQLVDASASRGAASDKVPDSFVNLTPYELDSEGGDTDRESAYGYDSDGDNEDTFYRTLTRKARRTSSVTSATSTSSSSGSVRSSGSVSSNGSLSSVRSTTLGFVPEDESLIGDFTSSSRLTLSDLEVDVESQRSDLLRQLNVESLECQRAFDALCELVSRALHCGVAAVGFMGESAQWYKAKIGISQAQLPRNVAFCSQLLDTQDPTVVLDASKDPRFCKNPLVTGSAHIRFYASTPICDPMSKVVLGSVFVMDPHPKSEVPVRTMEVLTYASQAVQKLLRSRPKTGGAKKRHSRTKRIHRGLSESAIASSGNSDANDAKAGGLFSRSISERGGELWTSTPPQPLASTSRVRSSRHGSGAGITLLDMESVTSLKRESRGNSAASDTDDEMENVLGRSAPPRFVSGAVIPPPAHGGGIRQQAIAAQQLLSVYGVPARKATIAEVEV
jgi:hypothetical protein